MKTKIILINFIAILIGFTSCKKNDVASLSADFEVSSEAIGAGESIDFVDNSQGQASSWSWTFEGGNPEVSNESGPTIKYELPGTYSVTLEIKYGDQSSVERKEAFITVGYNDVSPDFEASATTATQEEVVKFTDKTTGLPTSWSWEFKSTVGNTVITSTLQNPEIIFAEPGLYNVKLVATNPKSTKETTKVGYLTIIDKFSVEANFESNIDAIYTGGKVRFTDKSIGNATAWSWTFEGTVSGQTTSTSQNPEVTYATPGRHKVKLVASNAAKSSTKEVDKYILVVPGESIAAFYPFNGNSNDVGPNTLNPTPVGTGSAITYDGTDRKSALSKTAVFKGSKAFIVPDNPAYNFGTTNYSISCWIKTSVTSKLFIFAESGGKGSGDNQTWGRIGNNTTTQLTQFAVEQTGGSGFIAVGPDGKVSDNIWHHLAFVRDGKVTKLFIDGVKKGEATAGILVDVSNAGDFKIGVQEGTGGFGSYFIGQMDDMIIYRKALTEAEVLELFNL